MKKKHILEIKEAIRTLDLTYDDNMLKLITYLETGDNGCPYTISHTREWCGHAGCRES